MMTGIPKIQLMFGGLLLIVSFCRASAAPPAPLPKEPGDLMPHWAFGPPHRPSLPRLKNQRWVRNEIDSFILARLEQEAIKPSPQADRGTLARRLSLDLRGLPPSPEEIEEFLRDQRSDAYERLVDRMLASPQFGEQWGRHWLDLARYADSDGYEKDGVRPYAYLYRDWLIEAINRDLPFDQFTIEQLAGDLLPNATLAQKTATGFHRNTLINKEGGVDQEEFRCKATVDRVNTTGTVWLGLTIGCAECHSHKYDPISQSEFYQLYAFFNDASETDIPSPKPEEIAEYEKQKAAWENEQAALKMQLAGLESELGPMPSGEEQTSEALEKLKKQLADHARREPKFNPTKIAGLAQTQTPRPTYIHVRGDFLRHGDEVQPGTPAVLHPFRPREKTAPLGGTNSEMSARFDRLDLAHWLCDLANPLTSRVTVNRIWGHLFGKALVPTVDDFGTRGEKPSHPELLDWLATEFPRLGWSRKSLIKLIVTSATYRQSSRFRPALYEQDPANRLLARQNRFRLTAENIRDSVLAVSGLLNSAVAGPSIRPPLPADIAAVGYANSIKWKDDQGPAKYRRGLYVFFQRTVPYPMLMTFDAPDSNVTCTRRERSNTPLQALTLLNDPVFFEAAQALGKRLAAQTDRPTKEKIKFAFELCLARPPAAQEIARLQKLYSDQRHAAHDNWKNALNIIGGSAPARSGVVETAAWVALSRALLNLDEFVNRE